MQRLADVDSGPDRVIGIDFSGAKDAGKKVWIAEATRIGDGLRIDSVFPARDFPGSGRSLGECLSCLRIYITSAENSIIGIDFPFGLPRQIVDESTWPVFTQEFASRYPGPDEFQRMCTESALSREGKKELRRKTDREQNTPMSPYNRRIFKQTYFGIKSVLAPLVATDSIRVAPMQSYDSELPVVVEICPSSTMKAIGCNPGSFKKPSQFIARAKILDFLINHDRLTLGHAVRDIAIDNPGGDAVDAIIAATAANRAGNVVTSTSSADSDHLIEGFVYV